MKNLIVMFEEANRRDPPCDLCKCSECGWEGKADDCETDVEQDGWEFPKYTIHICPECPDGGCIDDYWYSEEVWETMHESDLESG